MSVIPTFEHVAIWSILWIDRARDQGVSGVVPKKDRASGGAAIGVAITISGQVASGYLSGCGFHPNQLELSLWHHFKIYVFIYRWLYDMIYVY